MFKVDIKSHTEGKNYKLTNINLQAAKGEFVSISGSSGSGKSLLFSICAGLLEPNDGLIHIDKKSLYTTSNKSFIYKDLGVIFQVPALISNLSVRQNLLLPIEQHYTTLNDQEKKYMVDFEAEQLHLGTSLDLRPGTLSNGKRERIAIARGIITSPKVVLWDTPLLYTDDYWNERIIERFVALKRQGTTVIIFTNHKSKLLEIFDTHYRIFNSTLEKIVD